jgi:serine/threonine protein kinase
LLPGTRSGDASIPAGCTGLCGLAHVSHDMWALGVMLYRFCARQSLFYEDDEDNIKADSDYLIELARWTDEFKHQRLQNIEDTATRTLVSKLLEKQPWKRPRSIDDVLAMPFNEMDVIKLKLQQTVPSDASQSSNLVGSVKDLRTGKFSDAAYGLRPYLQVPGDWNEEAACTLQGMQDEVDVLKDCPDCAQVQADALKSLKRSEADATLELKNHKNCDF